ncbi:hypothetical protein CXB65_06505 [Pseudomonas monteilii]|uniref:Uncharacterized protein n=1 Tax=Pseudomonas monteilii TaxID=76759 RepID=A0A2N1IW21_9PSED|nr:hypothetical protein CXB65_06505 [Pseudomonas monteilii]RPD93783.1 hypothetical protein EGN69_12860 [Pseudomonas monteilii]
MHQKLMADTCKGDFICAQSRMSLRSFTVALQHGGVSGAVDGVVGSHLVWVVQPQYLKYNLVGSNIGGHVVLRPKQLIKQP